MRGLKGFGLNGLSKPRRPQRPQGPSRALASRALSETAIHCKLHCMKLAQQLLLLLHIRSLQRNRLSGKGPMRPLGTL